MNFKKIILLFFCFINIGLFAESKVITTFPYDQFDLVIINENLYYSVSFDYTFRKYIDGKVVKEVKLFDREPEILHQALNYFFKLNYNNNFFYLTTFWGETPVLVYDRDLNYIKDIPLYPSKGEIIHWQNGFFYMDTDNSFSSLCYYDIAQDKKIIVKKMADKDDLYRYSFFGNYIDGNKIKICLISDNIAAPLEVFDFDKALKQISFNSFLNPYIRSHYQFLGRYRDGYLLYKSYYTGDKKGTTELVLYKDKREVLLDRLPYDFFYHSKLIGNDIYFIYKSPESFRVSINKYKLKS